MHMTEEVGISEVFMEVKNMALIFRHVRSSVAKSRLCSDLAWNSGRYVLMGSVHFHLPAARQPCWAHGVLATCK